MNDSQRMPSAFVWAIFLAAISQTFASQSGTSALFTQINGSEAFSQNFLSALTTNDSITEATGMARGPDGSVYILGNIEAIDSDFNKQRFATDESVDRLGEQDVFLLKLGPDGSVVWSKRFGSQGSDYGQAIAVGGNGDVFVTASIGRDMGEVSAGATIFRYSGSGTRIWVVNFGGKTGGDTLTGIAVDENSSEVIVSGTIGAQSSLHTNETRKNVPAVVIFRVSTKDGEVMELSVGDLFDSSAGVLANGLAAKIVNGSGRCFVVGSSLVKSGGSKLYNGAIYSFSYPQLIQLSKRQVVSQTEDAFVGVATSNNNYSVFAAGIADVSIYSELDGRVTRFNASNLALGWRNSIETSTFPDQASIEEGTVSEAARDVAVDEYGNLYVLLEASGSIGNDAQQDLKNRRPALIVYAPNGTAVHTVHANISDPTSARALLIDSGNVLVTGWTLDPNTLTTRVYLKGISLPTDAYQRHSSEFEPSTTSESDGGAESNEESSSNVGVIVGAAAGGLVLLMIIAVVVAVVAKKRGSNREPNLV